MLLPLLSVAFAAEPVLADSVQAVAARVAALRGADEVPDLSVTRLSTTALQAHLDQALREDPTRPTWPSVTRLCTRLGLLPAGTDLEASFRALLVAQVAGFYEPKTQRLYIADDAVGASSTLTGAVLAHEVAHALDDRAWDIAAIQARHHATLDEQLVVSSLIEGSATWQMYRYAMAEIRAGSLSAEHAVQAQKMSSRSDADPSEAPPFIAASLMAPYAVGLLWVADGDIDPAALVAPKDPARARMDGAARQLPSSMSTLLHPEDPPFTPVEVADAWATLPPPLHEDRVGELLVAAALRNGIPSTLYGYVSLDFWTSDAANGWRGDAFYVGDDPAGRPIEAWWTAWATEKDRREFVRAFDRRGTQASYDAIGDRVALHTWGLDTKARKALVAKLSAARWSTGGLSWSP